MTYIGQTGCSLKTRVQEHVTAQRLKNIEKSAFAAHLIQSGHNFDESGNVTLLHECDKGRILRKLEEIEIIRHLNDKNTWLVNDPSTVNHNIAQFFK